MTRDDAEAFSAVLGGLAEVFNITISPMRAELYFRALETLTLGEVQEAAGKAIRTLTFFPKPAELIAFVVPSEEENAEMAWLELLECFQKCDGYRFPIPDDDITQALVRVYWGSMARAWEWWRTCHEVALDHRRQEFLSRYPVYAARSEELTALPGGDIFTAIETHERRQLPSADA